MAWQSQFHGGTGLGRASFMVCGCRVAPWKTETKDFPMHILLINNSPIPVYGYGGTERVIWDLGKTLVQLGHRVSYLVPDGSSCDFGHVLPIHPDAPWEGQIPADVDIAHFQFNPRTELSRPYLVTEHGNARKPKPLPRNTVFLSRDHAARYGSSEFVYNGLDWSGYGPVDFSLPRPRYHFLGKAAWGVKNVRGAIKVAKLAGVELDVLGGDRINFKRGFRWTLSRKIHFHGMVGGTQKTGLLNASRGLIFPVRWHEPFGLAVIESLYFGCPVFSTPYGALPELVPADPCEPDIVIRLVHTGRAFPPPGTPGTFHFGDSECFLLYPQIGAFRIAAPWLIEVEPLPGIDPALVCFPLLGPVIALLLQARGAFLLHGSALAAGWLDKATTEAHSLKP